MKDLWNSFFQTVIQLVRDLGTGMSKAMHRSAVLMTAGILVVTMLTFMAGGLQVGGNNALVAFAETQEHKPETETELEGADSEEAATDKEIENENTDLTETADSTDDTEDDDTEEADDTDATAVEEHTENVGSENGALSSADEKTVKTFADVTEEEKKKLPGYEEERETIATAKSVAVLSDSDYQTLLKIVQAESGGCDITGKILVANVILNRVESDEFPNSVHGVVYQKAQFSPVIDGSINRCKITDETREAVDRALHGEDLSEGALYFMNRNKSSSRNVHWFDTKLSFLFKHGEHEFFK